MQHDDFETVKKRVFSNLDALISFYRIRLEKIRALRGKLDRLEERLSKLEAKH